MTDGAALLFVYGTLRPGHDGAMARWLAAHAAHLGAATARGRIYRIADYPGFVPGKAGWVRGDLFALADAPAAFAILDEHEECSDRFPQPHEYRRVRLMVTGVAGPVDAWTYVYARDVTGLAQIAGGDFLCAGASGG